MRQQLTAAHQQQGQLAAELEQARAAEQSTRDEYEAQITSLTTREVDVSGIDTAIEILTQTADRYRAQTPPPAAASAAKAGPTTPPTAPTRPPASHAPTSSPRPARDPRRDASAGDGAPQVPLRSGARRMVLALGRMAPIRLTKTQWGTVARLKTSGGTWSTYLSNLRQAGLLDENPAGYTLSEAGFAAIGGRPEPMDPHELQQHYLGILRAGAGKMLEALLDVYPSGLTREELAASADLAPTGGTFSTYLSDLTRNGLAMRQGERIIATSILVNGSPAGHTS